MAAREPRGWRWGSLAHQACGGGGDPVVLVHGFAGSRQQWTPLARVLCQRGYRVYWVDLPGHGESPKPREPEAYAPETWVVALAAWHQEHIGEPAWWVGHSLGGGLVVALARRHPARVLGGLLLAPYLHRRQLRTWVRLSRLWWPLLRLPRRYPPSLAPWLMYLWYGHPEYRRNAEQRRQRIAEFLAMAPRCWATVEAMREPVDPAPHGLWHVMAGPGDSVLRFASFEVLAQRWGVPLHVVPGARHMLHLTHGSWVLERLVALVRDGGGSVRKMVP